MITIIMILMPCFKIICNNFHSYILMASRLKWAPEVLPSFNSGRRTVEILGQFQSKK